MTMPLSEMSTIPLLYRHKELLPSKKFDDEDETSNIVPSQVLNNKIAIVRCDITKLEVDAIVNAANNLCLGGKGVDGAIHEAAGPELYKECKTLHGVATGSAKITGAYNLPSKKVIHAVGPVYDSDDKEISEEHLAGCYTRSMELAAENNCKSIAFSAISTGIYGYPSQAAAPIAIKAVKDFLEGENGGKIEKVVFCTFEMKDVIAYNDWIPRYFPPTENDLDENEVREKENTSLGIDGTSDEWVEVEAGETANN